MSFTWEIDLSKQSNIKMDPKNFPRKWNCLSYIYIQHTSIRNIMPTNYKYAFQAKSAYDQIRKVKMYINAWSSLGSRFEILIYKCNNTNHEGAHQAALIATKTR